VTSVLNPLNVVARINRDVERSLLRARNGVRYATTKANVGATPRDVVWRRDRAELWRYRSATPIRYHPPVVIVHSLVSRSYILDLRPGSSAVEFLLGRGHDVYMLDWGVADERDADNTLATYVDEYLPRAVAAARRESDSHEVTLAGYCLGGTFATLYAAGPDAPVRNLILMASPVDYFAMGAMVAAVREGRLNPDELVDESGNVPADALYSGFFMLAPTKQVAQYATLLENLWNDEFVEGYQAMSQWSRDHVPFPGAALREVVGELVRRNALMTGRVRVGTRSVDLGDVRANLLNAFADKDNVVPPEAAEPATTIIGRPERREELRLPGGHVTFATGRVAFNHTLPALSDWIVAHSTELEPPKER
jgi:poly[(R)-3-hydroxyalkanoate] polymerase subunit PhaC